MLLQASRRNDLRFEQRHLLEKLPAEGILLGKMLSHLMQRMDSLHGTATAITGSYQIQRTDTEESPLLSILQRTE